MTATRPRLVLLRGTPLSDPTASTLPSAFDVVEVENAEEARGLLESAEPGTVLLSAELAVLLSTSGPAAALQHIGEGVGVVDASGVLTWSNARLAEHDAELRERFTLLCRDAMTRLDRRRGVPGGPGGDRFSFAVGDSAYELVVSPSSIDQTGGVTGVVGVLWNVTSSRDMQRKIDAIDAAGSELMKIEAVSISRLDMAERLRLLEEKIVQYVHDLLSFDNFEIRLLDRQTGRLELVVAVGLTPLKIGEVIHAGTEGNGISGWVAATGESYICEDACRDPLYREGLDNAASSLTVPLRLHDEVIGVFNVESNTRGAFDDNDRQFTEIFGRYVAMAMHILDLMVVERYTTNEQVSANVLSELSTPIEEITRVADQLSANGIRDPEVAAELERLQSAVADIRSRIEVCTSGPRTILGAEEELRRHEPDPCMRGRRVLVADDEPEILQTLHKILLQKGCDVTACNTGAGTIAAIEAAGAAGEAFELVVSDIKLGDHNGYEIFRAAKAVEGSTHVILMTGFGYDPHHSIIRASQEGLHSLLFKPFKASQMLEAIGKAFT